MDNLILISLIPTIISGVIFYLFKKNIINNNPLSQEDIRKNNNKLILFICILVFSSVYGGLYMYDNKMLDSVISNTIEVKGGEPNF